MEFREDVYLGLKHPIVPPLMNGGGSCKTIPDVKELARSPAGAIVVGSITWEESLGNSGDVWRVVDGDGMNSIGLLNGGRIVLTRDLPEMVRIAHDAGKVLIVNVAGSNAKEYRDLTYLALENGADAVELNLGCPNIIKNDGNRKPIPSFDLEIMESIVFVSRSHLKDRVIWVKVSPYSDPELLKKAAKVLLPLDIKAVTAINTFPSAYDLKDDGSSLITPGFAGLSGRALKRIGLGQVMQWRNALKFSGIGIIAVGGISSAKDVRNYAAVGASGFQMTTELLKGGKLDARPFERILMEDVPAATTSISS